MSTSTVELSRSGDDRPDGDIELRLLEASVETRLFGSPAELVRLGRYVLLEKIGAGRAGVVYAAYDEQLDRKVAIKVRRWTSLEIDDRDRRLIREAHTLASLSHPNIVPLFDVGEIDGRWYLVMEFIRGRTLRAWQEATPRTWQETLDLYVQAGRGLAAAHAAGLVHRDFKPENVVVGEDGRVRVLDFGVAREDPAAAAELNARAALELTATGLVLGTPAYMAPEQFRGEPLDGRADEFSFCVALWEALHGERPFAGRDYRELRDRVLAGALGLPSKGRPIPSWLTRALTRGLAAAREERFASMDELVAALTPGRRARWPGFAALALVGGLGLGLLPREGPVERCVAAADQALTAVWSAPRRVETRARFDLVAPTNAASIWAALERRVDRYVASLRAMHEAQCSAPPGVGTSARAACLDERARELDVQLRVLGEADAESAQQALRAIDSLPRPTRCDDPTLASALDLPKDPERRAAIAALGEELRELAALARAGKATTIVDRAEAALARADALDYAPHAAEARALLGELRSETDLFATASDELFAALTSARAIGSRRLEVRAMLGLATVEGVKLSQERDGRRWIAMAEAQLGDPRSDPELATSLASVRAALDVATSNLDAAVERLPGELAFAEEHLGRGHSDALSLRLDLVVALWSTARYDASREVLDVAEQIVVEEYGADHPRYAAILNQRGRLACMEGDYEASFADYRDAEALLTRIYGPSHTSLVPSIQGQAVSLGMRRRHEEARPLFERLLRLLEDTHGPTHIALMPALDNLAVLYTETGDPARARAFAERAREIRERWLGAGHPELARSFVQLGRLSYEAGDDDAAIAEFERALTLRGELSHHLILRGDARSGLAAALLRSGRDPTRACALAPAALADLRTHGVVAIDAQKRAEAVIDECAARGLAAPSSHGVSAP